MKLIPTRCSERVWKSVKTINCCFSVSPFLPLSSWIFLLYCLWWWFEDRRERGGNRKHIWGFYVVFLLGRPQYCMSRNMTRDEVWFLLKSQIENLGNFLLSLPLSLLPVVQCLYTGRFIAGCCSQADRDWRGV